MGDGRASRQGTYNSKDELFSALNKMIEDDMKEYDLDFASIVEPYIIFRSDGSQFYVEARNNKLIFINEETLEPDEI